MKYIERTYSSLCRKFEGIVMLTKKKFCSKCEKASVQFLKLYVENKNYGLNDVNGLSFNLLLIFYEKLFTKKK